MMTTRFLPAELFRVAAFQMWDFLTGPISRGFRAVAQLRRTLRARREIASLLQFSNRELKDIGLTRNDVEAALSLPLLQDPSRKLAARIATQGLEG